MSEETCFKSAIFEYIRARGGRGVNESIIRKHFSIDEAVDVSIPLQYRTALIELVEEKKLIWRAPSAHNAKTADNAHVIIFQVNTAAHDRTRTNLTSLRRIWV